MAIIYKVTEIKTYLRAVVCGRILNMSKPDKESIRKEDDAIYESWAEKFLQRRNLICGWRQ